MEIGSSLNLIQNETDYRCKIIEKDEDFLYIDYPYDVKTGKTAFLIKGTHFVASFIDKNANVFQFNTNIIKYMRTTIPSIAITLPDKDKIKRIQRREFVRINTAVDISVTDEENPDVHFTTVTADISGGGVSIVVPNKYNLEVDKEYNLNIVLPMKTDRNHYINLIGRVVRLGEKNNVHTASIGFQDTDTESEQKIVRFCFEKQREERQKELR